MSEYKITLQVKHEPSVTELQILRDLIKAWCDEFCLEKEELSVRTLVDAKVEKLYEAMNRR